MVTFEGRGENLLAVDYFLFGSKREPGRLQYNVVLDTLRLISGSIYNEITCYRLIYFNISERGREKSTEFDTNIYLVR